MRSRRSSTRSSPRSLVSKTFAFGRLSGRSSKWPLEITLQSGDHGRPLCVWRSEVHQGHTDASGRAERPLESRIPPALLRCLVLSRGVSRGARSAHTPPGRSNRDGARWLEVAGDDGSGDRSSPRHATLTQQERRGLLVAPSGSGPTKRWGCEAVDRSANPRASTSGDHADLPLVLASGARGVRDIPRSRPCQHASGASGARGSRGSPRPEPGQNAPHASGNSSPES